MGTIPASQARGLYTQVLSATYKEMPKPTSFLKSFFPGQTSNSRYVSIEVERGNEKVAVDVVRGSEGNRNAGGLSTQKIFDPPYFSEYFDLTDLRHYDLAFGATGINESAIADLAVESAENTMRMRAKIERAYEKYCADALLSGIITPVAGTTIDFKRKAGSLVNVSGSNPWVTGSNDPRTDLKNAAIWLRQNGKAQGVVFNAIMGSSALAAFQNNDTIEAAGDILRINTMDIREPQRNAVGGSSHGMISAGDYIFRIWSYPEYYDNSSGVSTPYLDPKKVIVLPEAPKFLFQYAGVPRLINGNTQYTPAEFFVDNFQDERNAADIVRIKSAGIPIPVAIDQIYTVQVIV